VTVAQLTALFILIASPFVGSFLGVLADRLPRGEGIVAPRSRCRACGTALGPGELVPVLSYLARRGRCRHCGAPVAQWHLHVELGAIGLALLAVIAGGGPLALLINVSWLWLLLALGTADLLSFRLPNPLTATLLVAGLGEGVIVQGNSLGHTALAALVGSMVFLLIRVTYRQLRGREGLGLGDVKLMAGIGAGVGLWAVPMTVLLAALGGLGMALLDRKGLAAQRRLPFGATLCASAALVWALGPHAF